MSTVAYPDVTDELKQASIELFKKWHKTGFISLSYWGHADKVIIEIGSTDPDSNNSLKGATKCFVPVFQFMAYLRSEVNNNVKYIFPNFSDKGISFFGGGNVKGQVVSRIFNSQTFVSRDKVQDPMSRTFMCAHYEGTERDKGVVIPNFKAQLSYNTMKLGLSDIAEMFELLVTQVRAESVIQELKDSGIIK